MRFERTTCSLGGSCSVQLSYESGELFVSRKFTLELRRGILLHGGDGLPQTQMVRALCADIVDDDHAVTEIEVEIEAPFAGVVVVHFE